MVIRCTSVYRVPPDIVGVLPAVVDLCFKRPFKTGHKSGHILYLSLSLCMCTDVCIYRSKPLEPPQPRRRVALPPISRTSLLPP